MAFIKLDTIIKQLCRRTGEPEYRNYDDILEHVVSGCRQLNLLAMPTVDYVKVNLNRYNAIDWPLACIKPIMVGQMRCGRLVTISLDDSIVSSKMNTGSCKTIGDAEKEICNIFSDDYNPGYAYATADGELTAYGYGYNHLGYVTHDKKARQSYVKGCYEEGDEFVMVFKSDGVSDGMQYVPAEAEMCIKSFALREYYTVKQPTLAERQDMRYKEEFTAMRKFLSAITADDWKDVFNNMQN